MHDLPDVQAYTSGFPRIPIKKVGMRHIQIPFDYRWPLDGRLTRVLGTFESFSELEPEHKGINMSRITRTLTDLLSQQGRSFSDLQEAARLLKDAHLSQSVMVRSQFLLPYTDTTQLTNLVTPETLEVILESQYDLDGTRNFLAVRSTEMSLCPCSKEMSLLKHNITPEEQKELEGLTPALREKVLEAGFGAHNQKSHVELKVELAPNVVLDPRELLEIIKASVSVPTLTILKRPDEKYETEVAYMGGYIDEKGSIQRLENGGPKFVEDIARGVAHRVQEHLLGQKVVDFRVEVNNEESIHSNGILATAILGPTA